MTTKRLSIEIGRVHFDVIEHFSVFTRFSQSFLSLSGKKCTLSTHTLAHHDGFEAFMLSFSFLSLTRLAFAPRAVGLYTHFILFSSSVVRHTHFVSFLTWNRSVELEIFCYLLVAFFEKRARERKKSFSYFIFFCFVDQFLLLIDRCYITIVHSSTTSPWINSLLLSLRCYCEQFLKTGRKYLFIVKNSCVKLSRGGEEWKENKFKKKEKFFYSAYNIYLLSNISQMCRFCSYVYGESTRKFSSRKGKTDFLE